MARHDFILSTTPSCACEKKHWSANAERKCALGQRGLKECGTCEGILPATEEYFRLRLDSRGNNVPRSVCRNCDRSYKAVYAQGHKEDRAKREKRRRERDRENYNEQARVRRQPSRDKLNAQQRERRKRNPEKGKLYSRRARMKKYGLTLEQWEELKAAQKGLCKICGKTPGKKGLVVDHQHKTGKIRGLLCSFCNTALGLLNDSPEQLRRAFAYLKTEGFDGKA